MGPRRAIWGEAPSFGAHLARQTIKERSDPSGHCQIHHLAAHLGQWPTSMDARYFNRVASALGRRANRGVSHAAPAVFAVSTEAQRTPTRRTDIFQGHGASESCAVAGDAKRQEKSERSMTC